MKMTIYMPDELAAEVKAELGDQNISAICQAALRNELNRVRARAEIGVEGFERVQLYDGQRGRNVAFKGRQLASSEDDTLTAYITAKGAIAVYYDPDAEFSVYDTYEAFIDGTQDADLLAAVARALAEEYAEELDI